MAMNADVLGALIGTKMDAGIAGIEDPAVRRTAALKAIAEAVIEHIQSAAQIAGVICPAGTGTAPPGSIA